MIGRGSLLNYLIHFVVAVAMVLGSPSRPDSATR